MMIKKIMCRLTRQLLAGFIFVLLVLTQGCKSSSKLIAEDRRIALTKDNLAMINGRYKNAGAETLWSHLKPFFRGVNSKSAAACNPSIASVEVKVLNGNRIQFTYYESEKLRETKAFSYQNRDGIILIKTVNNFSLQGIPLLFFRQHREALNLALDKNSNLLLSYEGVASGGLFIIIFGSSIKGESTYIRE